MSRVFGPRANAWTRNLLIGGSLAAVVGTAALIFLNSSSYATGRGSVPEQPVPFSHKHHVGGLGLDCGYCHTSYAKSDFAGLPDTHTCMTCHSQLWTNATMLEPVRESLEKGQPLSWTRVNDLGDFVYFSHRMHVNNGVGCESCHGRVDTMPLMRQAKPLTMQWCLDCHRNPAPHLRRRENITAMGLPPRDAGTGKALMAHYDIDTDTLDECDVCHR